MKMFIDNKWVGGERDIEIRNPFDGSVVDTVPDADEQHARFALESAVRGFRVMGNLASYQRSEMLRVFADRLKERFDELVDLLVKEVGKTVKEAVYEVTSAIEVFECAAEESKRIHGETIPFDATKGGERKIGFFQRVPLGVIVAITPFNFPLLLPSHKVAPALAAGNCVIVKPSPKSCLSTLKLGEIALEAGLPAGALNIVTARGTAVAEKLMSDNRPRMVSFTGSRSAANQVAKTAGLKKLCMELGSNSAVIIMKDADLAVAVPRTVFGAFSMAGQICFSVQRILVQTEKVDEFLPALLSAVQKLRIGDPSLDETDVGPMVSDRSARRAEEWVAEAVSRGARLLCGGKRHGSLFEPTVLFEPSRDVSVWQEEVFAPVVVIKTFQNVDDAISLGNDGNYGLQAGIYGNDIDTVLRLARGLQVGGVIVNDIPTFRVVQMPYGGTKGSGFGREGPRYAIEEMTEIKLVCVNLAEPRM